MGSARQKTEREVANLKSPGRHSIGGNLVLQVSKRGARSWIARVTDHRGRRRDIGLGSCKDVTLSLARERVHIARTAIAQGRDPVESLHPTPMPSFEELAREFHAGREATYRNAKHCKQWITSLETYVFPHIGSFPIDEVKSSHLMSVLQPIWLTKEETARRVLQRIASVVAYAVPKGFREDELPVHGLRSALPKQTHRVRHHPACPVEAAPAAFQRLLDHPQSTSRDTLILLILTATRSNEVRGARWDEIDFKRATWTIPADRMKAKREHTIPLASQVVAFLESIPRIVSDVQLVFPNMVGKPLSDTALSKISKHIVPGVTVHGWRSTFRDWAAEKTNHRDEIAEAALAHADTNRIRAAYKRTDLLDKRRGMMGDWAKFLSKSL